MGKKCRFLMVTAGLVLLLNQSEVIYARDRVDIVSPSIVYPFAEAVAETIANRTGFARPSLTMAETYDALKVFCDGDGLNYPDIAGASRRIHSEEIERCIKNGVADIIEIPIGYMGIVLVRAKPAPVLSLDVKDIYLAVNKHVQKYNRTSPVANRATQWSEVNSALPDLSISFVGPPKNTDTRYAFEQLAIFRGCIEINSYAAQLKERKADLNYVERLTLQGLCTYIREDGLYQSVEDVPSLIRQLTHDSRKIGIFEFNSLVNHLDQVQPLPINGVLPSAEAITTGKYPLAQPLFLYIKKAHLEQVPGLWSYLAFFTSEGQIGPAGELVKNGLIPLPTDERRYAQANFETQKTSQLLAVIK